VSYHVDESIRSVATEKTWEIGSNARMFDRQRRTPYERHRVGLRVNDKASGAKRSFALE
jgi:hypothetical protein